MGSLVCCSPWGCKESDMTEQLNTNNKGIFYIVKAMAFPVVMYRCESWTKKKLSAKELMLLNCDAREDS